MEKTKHTPGPWKVSNQSFGNVKNPNDLFVWSKAGLVATAATIHEGAINAEANAAYIVRAANSHDALVAACKRLALAAQCRENTMGDPCRLLECRAELEAAAKVAREAIAKAEGRST